MGQKIITNVSDFFTNEKNLLAEIAEMNKIRKVRVITFSTLHYFPFQ